MLFESYVCVQCFAWSMAFASLSDLPLGRAYCAICVRVVRLWDYCGNKEDQPPLHVDMVLVDDKENRMYAEIPGTEAEKFKTLIHEGRVYVFRKFVVSASKPAYKPFEGNQMIRFTPWTTVEKKSELADRLPKYVFDLVDFQEFPSRVGLVKRFIDAVGIIVGVSEVAYVHLPSNQSDTAKRVITLKDVRYNQINLVLWGSRASAFDAEGVHSVGQESPVVAVFVGMLLKSYKGETTLSGGSACKWYINEEIPEIEKYFDRMLDAHSKIAWISAGEQQFRDLEQQRNLEEKTVMELRDMDPWEFEGPGYQCTVTISRINNNQPWWFSSCTKCHRASIPCGSQYKCSGGCTSTTAEPKYRLSLVGTDGTGTAEFTLFGRVARQAVGKPVVALMRSSSKNQHESSGNESEHMLPELATLVSQKFTFSMSISQKNLTQRNVSFQVNSIVTFHGKQSHIPRAEQGDSSRARSLAVVSPGTLYAEKTGVSVPSKKPRLDRRTIPCRKSLSHVLDGSEMSETSIHTKSDATAETTPKETLPVQQVEDSEVLEQTDGADVPEPVLINDSLGKVAEPTQNTPKQRSCTGRKKSTT